MGVDGDEVWVHSVFTGTHTGEFAGIPATGRSVSLAMSAPRTELLHERERFARRMSAR